MKVVKYQQYQIANTDGKPANVFERPSTDSPVVEKLVEGNLVGRATGLTFINGIFDDNTPVRWIEFEEDPYGYPPKRYVPERYLKTYGAVVLPEATVTAEKTQTETETESNYPVSEEEPVTNWQKAREYAFVIGLTIGFLGLIAALNSKQNNA